MRLADFMCIGAQKSATSWFYAMLQQHPNIWMPPIKELHFFNRMTNEDRAVRNRYQALIERQKNRGREKNISADWADYLDRVSALDEISLPWYREVFSWPVAADVGGIAVNCRHRDKYCHISEHPRIRIRRRGRHALSANHLWLHDRPPTGDLGFTAPLF